MRIPFAIAILLVGCAAPAAAPRPPAAAPSPAAPAVAVAPSAPEPPAGHPGLAYPPARKGDVVETHHGVPVPDPYRWLEDIESADVRRWVTDENTLTDGYLGNLAGTAALRAPITELVSYETFSIPSRRGGRYFWLHSDGTEILGFLAANLGLGGG